MPQSISDLGYASRMKLRRTVLLLLFLILFSSLPAFAQSWNIKLDKDIRFYQLTELGIVIAGTEKSLYALDGSTGEILWRRKDTSLDETDVALVPGTNLLLLSFEKSDKARIEAVDTLTGESIWRSEKIKGAVMQTSVDRRITCLLSCSRRMRRTAHAMVSNATRCCTFSISRPATNCGNPRLAKWS